MQTPLQQAIMTCDPIAVRDLLESKADPNESDTNGNPPLHYAVEFGHVGIVQQLLDAGADRQAKDKVGRTALELAKANGQSGLISLLQ